MSCFLQRGFILACNEGVGGVKDVYLANWEDFEDGIQFNVDGEISVLPTANLYRYQPNRNTGACTTTPTPNLENGTLYYTQTVEFTLGKLELAKKIELENMSKAKVIAFVRMYDDQIMCVGRTDGAFLTAGTYQTGKAKGDLNGYQITITAEEPNQPDFLKAPVPAAAPFSNFSGITVIVEPEP